MACVCLVVFFKVLILSLESEYIISHRQEFVKALAPFLVVSRGFSGVGKVLGGLEKPPRIHRER